MRKVLTGPHGIQLILDSKEICPDDPGNGTPVMVQYKHGSSTYNCACGEGYVDGGREGDIRIPDACLNWLNSDKVSDAIEAMYNAGPNGDWE